MKKSFRNKLFAVSAVAVSSVLVLCGFDANLTSKDLLVKSTDAMANAPTQSITMKGTVDAVIETGSGDTAMSLPVKADANIVAEYTTAPFNCHVSGNLAANAMQQADLEFDMYLLQQDDHSGIVYMKYSGMSDSAGWNAQAVPEEAIEELQESLNTPYAELIASASSSTGMDCDALVDSLLSDAAVAPSAVNVNGKDCYEVSESVSGSEFAPLIDMVEGLAIDTEAENVFDAFGGVAVMEIAKAILGSIQMDVVSDFDAETFLPVYSSVDFTNTDFSTIATLAGAVSGMSAGEEGFEIPQIRITANALKMEASYDPKKEVAIDPPAEARSVEVLPASILA